MQALRRHRFPVCGQALATELRISLRTLYRDVASLRAQGAHIEGEPGLGYVLRPGFVLPPLMFSEEEIEALVLGTRWVASRADQPLGLAARNVIAKISAVLPAELRHMLDASALLVGPAEATTESDLTTQQIRQAIRAQRKLEIAYRDLKGNESARSIWPFAMGFFDQVRVIVAWCELRQEIRHFRTDNVITLRLTGEAYPRHGQALLKEWRASQGISPS